MSDGFDKEAEREKLREKFARDEEKRGHTQRMSELLLQGATMTNRHCDDCGDPIFRHDGREFCPTCQASEPDDAESTPGAIADTDGSPSQPASEGIESEGAPPTDATEPTAETPASAATERGSVGSDQNVAVPNPTDAAPATNPTDTAPATNPTDSEPQTGANTSRPAGSRGHYDERPQTSSGDRSAKRSATADSGTVADARESLTETLVRFAREAEMTDDPRRARDHLQAAREAAEALAALD